MEASEYEITVEYERVEKTIRVSKNMSLQHLRTMVRSEVKSTETLSELKFFDKSSRKTLPVASTLTLEQHKITAGTKLSICVPGPTSLQHS